VAALFQGTAESCPSLIAQSVLDGSRIALMNI
jgi:hypothetical protein